MGIIQYILQVVRMELDKRVSEIETEIKLIKGEIKELLVDIRDLVNKNENPFCNIPSTEVFKTAILENDQSANDKSAMTVNWETELKSTAGIPRDENQIIKKSEKFQKIDSPGQENFQNAQKQEMHRPDPENFRKIDTFMLVELMRWVDYAVRTIGHRNLEELLNLYTLTGYLPEETKGVIENIANLSIEEPAGEDGVSMKDNIMVLSQLSAILNPEDFRKNIQPLYEASSGWKGKEKEKEKKEGLVFN
ncbi:hypothetical protein ACSAZL_04580 [Methanosarcina sp. T3]|uniref:hypothetical protein n=1 Tax=Methanosarcina sp. T3 TaxID=3439062 RepID=UPI003F82DE63